MTETAEKSYAAVSAASLAENYGKENVTVQPCTELVPEMCCKLAYISIFGNNSVYGEPPKLLVFIYENKKMYMAEPTRIAPAKK